VIDEDDLRALVVRVVEQAGYAVDSAADGQAGLDTIG
jgi:DNA-binding response OmpR family regulator